MTKKEFIDTLKKHLDFLDESERIDIIADYEEHFTNELKTGKNEHQISSELGNPVSIANGYLKDGQNPGEDSGADQTIKQNTSDEKTDFFFSQEEKDPNRNHDNSGCASENPNMQNNKVSITMPSLSRCFGIFIGCIVTFTFSVVLVALSVALFAALISMSVVALVYGFGSFFFFSNIGIAFGAFLIGIGWTCLMIFLFRLSIRIPMRVYRMIVSMFKKNFNLTRRS